MDVDVDVDVDMNMDIENGHGNIECQNAAAKLYSNPSSLL
jgi:hypothetical protein